MHTTLNPQHQRFIEEAAVFLEKPSALIQTTDRLGRPLDKLQSYLPEPVQQLVKQAVQQALRSALQAAIKTLPNQNIKPQSWPGILEATQRLAWKHTAAVTTTGAIGGALGTAALMVELPLTTSLILRSISSMAQQWGHDLRQSEIQMQCLYVFTLGSPHNRNDDAMDTAYLSARIAWHGLIRELAAFISTHSLKDLFLALELGTLPALVKFVGLFVPALERTLLRGALSKSIPILSAVGSAALNAGFCQYFTRAARYHFGLMHLEALYGSEVVHEHYAAACRVEITWPDVRLIS
ncbi:EcsC family protein [Oligoflexus tunisiensis]|uniref:EcsC family protein n=1 Tax=Oligoflexus tunisiensis TaxID=708132 RepID=UPI00159F0CBE|nr:EcsC family protein [Oligoflexus tunisiensis]